MVGVVRQDARTDSLETIPYLYGSHCYHAHYDAASGQPYCIQKYPVLSSNWMHL